MTLFILFAVLCATAIADESGSTKAPSLKSAKLSKKTKTPIERGTKLVAGSRR
jgi:hypothetical protein